MKIKEEIPQKQPVLRRNPPAFYWENEVGTRILVTGTDPDAKTYLDSYILDYKTKKGKAVRYIMIPWGREGEVDCCFDLKDLTVSEQSDFIEGLRNTMKARELIQINENAKNRFKSR